MVCVIQAKIFLFFFLSFFKSFTIELSQNTTTTITINNKPMFSISTNIPYSLCLEIPNFKGKKKTIYTSDDLEKNGNIWNLTLHSFTVWFTGFLFGKKQQIKQQQQHFIFNNFLFLVVVVVVLVIFKNNHSINNIAWAVLLKPEKQRRKRRKASVLKWIFRARNTNNNEKHDSVTGNFCKIETSSIKKWKEF